MSCWMPRRHFVAPDPVLTNFGEISQIMQAQIDLLLIGEERDAKVVCDEIVRQVNPLHQRRPVAPSS